MLKSRVSDIGLIILLCPEVQPWYVWTAFPVQVRYIFPLNVLVGKHGKCFGFGRRLGRWARILTLHPVHRAPGSGLGLQLNESQISPVLTRSVTRQSGEHFICIGSVRKVSLLSLFCIYGNMHKELRPLASPDRTGDCIYVRDFRVCAPGHWGLQS